MHNYHCHVWPVLVAALIQWVFAAIWYCVGFRKRWSKLVGDVKPANRAFAIICWYVACAILCFVLCHVLCWAGTSTFMGGLGLGIVCWLGFMAPLLFAQHIWERRPANLFAINAVYWMVAMALAGGVLGVWR